MRSLSFRITRPAGSLHHGPVASPLLHELLVGSRLADGASFQKEDVVSLLHGAETLGDEKHGAGASLGALIQELLHLGNHRDSVRAQGGLVFPEPTDLASTADTCVLLSKTFDQFRTISVQEPQWNKSQSPMVKPVRKELRVFNSLPLDWGFLYSVLKKYNFVVNT